MTDLIELPAISSESIALIATEEGLKPFLDHAKAVAEKALKEVNDATTDKGRKAIGKLAAQVSKSKTAISGVGAPYVKELKAKPVVIQKILQGFYDDMDAIRDEIKRPADEWKAADKARIDKLHDRIDAIGALTAKSDHETCTMYTSVELGEKREIVAAMTFDATEFGDLHEVAMDTWNQSLEFLDAAIIERKAVEDMAADNERLKSEALEVQKAREIEQAVAQAKLDDVENHAAAIAAEKLKTENAEQAARDKMKAEQAELDAADRKIKEAAELKASNIEHQKAVNNTTMNELMQCCEGLTDTQAKKLISNFAHNKFTHITINY